MFAVKVTLPAPCLLSVSVFPDTDAWVTLFVGKTNWLNDVDIWPVLELYDIPLPALTAPLALALVKNKLLEPSVIESVLPKSE